MTEALLENSNGYPDGQLCPYDDCCHDLAIPAEGWYSCGHCQRLFFARVWDGDYEDYFCYKLDDAPPLQFNGDFPPERITVMVARDLGPSWGTPIGEESR